MAGRKWYQWEIDLLGTDIDERIAFILDRSHIAVRMKRHRLEIPPYHALKREWTMDELSMLANVPDHRIAEILGINRKTVMAERRRRGLPTYSQQFNPPAGNYKVE